MDGTLSFTELVRRAARAEHEAVDLVLFPAASNRRSYRGVRPHYGKFGAEIRDLSSLGSKRVWLGTYETAKEAAYAYDIAARAVKGDKAIPNFPVPPPLPVDEGATVAIVHGHFAEAKRVREARGVRKRLREAREARKRAYSQAFAAEAAAAAAAAAPAPVPAPAPAPGVDAPLAQVHSAPYPHDSSQLSSQAIIAPSPAPAIRLAPAPAEEPAPAPQTHQAIPDQHGAATPAPLACET